MATSNQKSSFSILIFLERVDDIDVDTYKLYYYVFYVDV